MARVLLALDARENQMRRLIPTLMITVFAFVTASLAGDAHKPKISMTKAREIALKRVPGGRIQSARPVAHTRAVSVQGTVPLVCRGVWRSEATVEETGWVTKGASKTPSSEVRDDAGQVRRR